MKVLNVRWVGIRTDRYDEMVGFLRDVLGLRTNFEEPTTVEFETSEGDEVQVMAPGDPYYDFFGEHATGPVPLFEVDDVGAARARGGRHRNRGSTWTRHQLGLDSFPRSGRQPVRAREPPGQRAKLSGSRCPQPLRSR